MADNIHASAVVIGERGVLVLGPSGSGKSALCFGLIEAARVQGLFGAWVGDDQLLASVHGGRLCVRPAPGIAGLAEQRGFGPVAVAHLPGAVIDLAVRLVEPQEAPRLPEPDTEVVAGVSVARVRLPMRENATNARATLHHLNRR